MVRHVLMVAEKPSLAESISSLLSNGAAVKRSRALPVYEYDGDFYGQAAHFKVTSTTGHVFSCDFTTAHQNWEKTPEEELFAAPTVKKENGGRVVHHLAQEAEGCDTLVLWLDCDREGENICFEVMHVVRKSIHRMDNVWRAKFSAITKEEITHAFRNLGKPNKCISDAVECRQELDLKVGCAFTRFQTTYFNGKYGLDSHVVSYGPCQTPTLAFCVARHDEILNFKAENFWRISVVASRAGSGYLQFEWQRIRIFDEPMARLLHQQVAATKLARVADVAKSLDSKPRPIALNTVELLKIASKALGMAPHHALHTAEQLYLGGYISYPRTETTQYPATFDLVGALSLQKSNAVWGGFVKELLDRGITRPKSGSDKMDHPPISPTRAASPSQLSGDEWRIYELITRHFIATLSPDCTFRKTRITLELNGERFSVAGRIVEEPGFTVILPTFAVQDDRLPEVNAGDEFPVSDVRLTAGQTQPPGYLTESDLIELMENHGIGTDASIATHIKNIFERNYASIRTAGRTIEPTKLGIVLVHGFMSIDPELVLPLVRSKVEEYVSQIADGKANLDAVLKYALELFRAKFDFFKLHVGRMDSLMGASFSPLESSGKFLTRCGTCQRYLRHLETRPQRLYCQTCERTFNLPQGATVKQYANFTCPLDGFELVICHVDGGKSFSVCPQCYNDPPFAELEGKHMCCDECKHPTCMHSLATNYVADCVDPGCTGSIVFVPRSTGAWKACCNHCTSMLLFPATACKMRVAAGQECTECGAQQMEMHFPAGKSPLPTRVEHVIACVFCDAALSSLVQEVKGRAGNFGRGGFGRGRGGGRGRGRGRGGRDRRDPG